MASASIPVGSEVADGAADLELDVKKLQDAVEVSWLVLNGALIMLMQLGFAMLEVGSVRVFHMQNILIKNVVDGVITIGAWFVFGYALYTDGGAVFGYKHWFLMDTGGSCTSGDSGICSGNSGYLKLGDFFLAVAFAASSVTIVSGAMAERTKLPAYFIFSFIMGGIIYPIAAHWVWNADGWLSAFNTEKTFPDVLGYLDYAGGVVVHGLGGAAALVAVSVLGPRHGRFGIDGEVVELEGVVVRSCFVVPYYLCPVDSGYLALDTAGITRQLSQLFDIVVLYCNHKAPLPRTCAWFLVNIKVTHDFDVSS